tara:strand:+ start:12959 stop:13579 length:621 start_codon:yes stop_codon:yes gene_type:complete
MSNILISLNGECSIERNQLQSEYQLIFGVDGGTEFLYKLFLQPDRIIGDFDSIDDNTKKRALRDGAEISAFSSDKDKTDLEIALGIAKENNASDITIIGGEGKELDHLFANLLTLSSFHSTEEIKWITKLETIIFSKKNYFKLKKNTVFSILPLSNIKNLSIKGAKWEIKNEEIPYGSTKTLRNISLDDKIFIDATNGKYCLIVKN